MILGKKTDATTRAATLVNDLCGDPELLAAVAAALAPFIFSSANVRDLLDAVETVTNSSAQVTPGRLYAATVTALTLNGSSVAIRAKVTLNGATTPTVAYIPPHIRSAIATTQDVWIEAVNGNMNDLKVDSLRNIP